MQGDAAVFRSDRSRDAAWDQAVCKTMQQGFSKEPIDIQVRMYMCAKDLQVSES
jgi:hypothetical protein